MRKWSTYLLFFFAFFILGVWQSSIEVQASSQQVRLMIEGVLEQPNTPAKIVGGRTFVPLRFISEKMGAEINWQASTQEVQIKKDEKLLVLHIGQKKIQVNGQAYEIDAAPILEEGRTLVPIRFVSEYLGLDVGWQQESRTVILNKPLTVFLNGYPLAKEQQPLSYAGRLYFPVFHLAKELHITVQDDQEEEAYLFNLDAGQKVLLPKSEVIKVDGLEMAPYEWLDYVLGTTSMWDQEQALIFITKKVSLEPDGEDHLANGYAQLSEINFVDNQFTFQLDQSQLAYNHFFLQSPHRLVIDLSETVLAEQLLPVDQAFKEIAVNNELVNRIRISRFSDNPATVRIVFDLNKQVSAHLQQVDEQLQVQVQERKPLVVIDPGHGGSDPGAIGTYSKEKDIVLSTSLKIYQLLQADPNFDVLITRTDDTYPTLDERVQFANGANADLFISVHANAATKASIGGTETFIFYNADKTFGRIVHKHLIEATQLENRGLKEAGFKVIKGTSMPAVLIEMAFISNQHEEKLLNDPAFQERVAQAMYNAVQEYAAGLAHKSN